MDMLFRPFTSTNFLILVLIFWIGSAIGSVWYIAPSFDQSFYVKEGLGVIYFAEVGRLKFDIFLESFSTLPGFSVLTALFFKLWTLLGLPFAYETHKVWLVLLVIVNLAVLTHFLIGYGRRIGDRRTAPIALSLMLLGITPFAMDVLTPRPEVAGLLFFVASLNVYMRAWVGSQCHPGWAALAGLLLGCAAVQHPGLMIVAVVMCLFLLVDLLMRQQFVVIFSAAAGTLIPVGLMMAWFFVHAPDSFEVLLNSDPGRTKNVGGSLNVLFKFATMQGGQMAMVNLYYAVTHGALLLLLAAVAVLAVFRLRRFSDWRSDPVRMATSGFVAGALIYMLIDAGGRVQLFVVVSYAAVMFLSILLLRSKHEAGRT